MPHYGEIVHSNLHEETGEGKSRVFAMPYPMHFLGLSRNYAKSRFWPLKAPTNDFGRLRENLKTPLNCLLNDFAYLREGLKTPLKTPAPLL
jgi:hypothetical protein